MGDYDWNQLFAGTNSPSININQNINSNLKLYPASQSTHQLNISERYFFLDT